MGSQADAFKAQTQVSRMLDELLRLAREQPAIEAELIRALGRNTAAPALIPDRVQLQEEIPTGIIARNGPGATSTIISAAKHRSTQRKSTGAGAKELLPGPGCTFVLRPA